MTFVDSDYRNPNTKQQIIDALIACQTETVAMPVFVCIGSDRHMLDCFGPLTGTMLQESIPSLIVYGFLDQPLHARNLTREMMVIKKRHGERKFIAIDAAVGEENEIGHIQFRAGAILPGKAVAQALPAIGDYALTAIVAKRGYKHSEGRASSPSFAPVYHMAKLVQQAVASWYSLHQQ